MGARNIQSQIKKMSTANPQEVRNIAADVDIGRVIARATLADKLTLVCDLQAQWLRIGMIGDEINDASALAAARRLSPMIASAAMVMSLVSVVTNSLRLQKD